MLTTRIKELQAVLYLIEQHDAPQFPFSASIACGMREVRRCINRAISELEDVDEELAERDGNRGPSRDRVGTTATDR